VLDNVREDFEKLKSDYGKVKAELDTELKAKVTGIEFTVEELKKMYARDHRPGMGGELDQKAANEDYRHLFYDAVRYQGLRHLNTVDGVLKKYAFDDKKGDNWARYNGYGNYGEMAQKAIVMSNLPRAGILATPATIMREILDMAKLQITNLRNYVRVERIDAMELEVPVITAHSVASRTSETGTRAKDATLKFGDRTIRMHEAYHYFDVSHQMLLASAWPLESLMMSEAARAFQKLFGTETILGTGVGEYMGILKHPDINSVNLEETTNITKGDYLKKLLVKELKADYKTNAKWLMSSDSLWRISCIKGGDGHYLVRGMTEDQDFRLFAKEIIVSEDMPSADTINNYPVAIGDWYQAYMILDSTVGQVLIQDPYSLKTTGIVEFLQYAFSGGGVLIPEAYKVGKMANT